MKKNLLFIFFCCAAKYDVCVAQAGEWTWMKGDSTFNSDGIWGIQGVADSGNKPPALYEASEWRDFQGNFWLFGGLDQNGQVENALWKYHPSLNLWTWMSGSNIPSQPGVYGTQGIPSPNNHPGARAWGAASWVDQDGSFWLFGGYGTTGELNDLWKYDVANEEWTWISDSSGCCQSGVYGIQGISSPNNHPGARWETNATWVDNIGNLWLFGGYRGTSFNDLWKFDVSTNEWTWMKGSNLTNQPGTYGTLGIADSASTPGARQVYAKWKDSTGNFWLFAGYKTSWQNRNDVWKYTLQNNEWTWMSGSDTVNPQSSLTSNCDPAVTNAPSGRFENRSSWSDCGGTFWTFGGFSDGIGTKSYSDLWSFNSSSLEWSLVKGDTAENQPGLYGIQGFAAPANYPKARGGAISWIDDSCNLYMFGGSYGWSYHLLNDLWKFKPDPSCPGTLSCNLSCYQHTYLNASLNSLCEKFCTNFSDQSSNNPTVWQWQFPGGNPSSSTLQNPNNICYNTPGTYDVTLITTNANGNDTLTLHNYVTVYPTPPFPTITQAGYTLASSPASSYQWQLNSVDIPGATNQSYNVLQSGYYTVIVGNSNGCKNSFTQYVLISGIGNAASEADISIYPNPSSGNFTIELLNEEIFGEISIDVVNTLGQKVFSNSEKISFADWKKEINLSEMVPGVYFIEIKTENLFLKKKIIIMK